MHWSLKHGEREIPIAREIFVVGRERRADLYLDDPQVSRRHARLRVAAGLLQVEDLGSRNGTFKNNVRISTASLVAGDVLTIGPFTLAVTQVADEAAQGGEPATQPMSGARLSPSGDMNARTDQRSLSLLSPREREIFGWLARGATQREIAAHFGVSVKTIETHRTRIGQKLGVRSRAELLRIALDAGVLAPNQPH